MLERIWTFLRAHVRPAQVCWLCVAGTLGIGWFVTAKFAPAGELEALKVNVKRLESDGIASDLYDFQRAVCATSGDKQWLRKQMGEKQDRFRSLNSGRDYQLPGCGDL